MELSFPSPALVCMAGLPGVGKSTLIARTCPTAQHIVIDDYIHDPGEHDGFVERFLYEVEQALALHPDVVADWTGRIANIREQLTRAARAHGHSTHLLLIRGTIDEAKAGQVARRGYIHPDDLMLFQAAQLAELEFEIAAGEHGDFDSVTAIDRATAAQITTIRFV